MVGKFQAQALRWSEFYIGMENVFYEGVTAWQSLACAAARAFQRACFCIVSGPGAGGELSDSARTLLTGF
jgi:hypothetical protein